MRAKRLLIVVLAALVAVAFAPGSIFASPQETDTPPTPAGGPAAFGPASDGCLTCHNGIESMHDNVAITCVGCHGGNGSAKTKEEAHVHAKHPGPFTTSANPVNSFAALNFIPSDYIRFINPGDLRIADQTCGQAQCHATEVATTRTSIMGHNAMAHNAVFYNNGAIDSKVPIYGESFLADGRPAKMIDNPTPEEMKRGALKELLPHPAWFVTKARDPFRIFERGADIVSKRGPGTDGRIAGVFLNVLKTRLNDPTLWFYGGNQIGGDYRGSGCTACHVLYANDKDPTDSGDIAKYGHSGFSFTADKSIPKNEPGHPIHHKLATSIPTSQCMTCHHHQGNGALGNYQGVVWWDRETDAEQVLKVDGWTGAADQADLASHNSEFKDTQFSDQHGHSWNYQKVYLRDLRGRLLDSSGKIIGADDPDKWAKAVHLKDIHLEKGMHCIDCHTHQDLHGDGNIYAQMTDAIEIRCEDCHGTVTERATLVTSGPDGSHDLTLAKTPFGRPQFLKRRGKILQNSKMTKGLQWEVPQLVDVVDPTSDSYNPRAARVKTMLRDGTWGGAVGSDSALAHSDAKMECYSCHSAWNNNCAGCHLPLETNRKRKDLHYTNLPSRGYAAYNRQTVRTDSFMLGIGTMDKGSKVTTMRSASAVVVSAQDGNRNWILHQQPTVSTAGFAGSSVTPNVPHTVRAAETKKCSDCHLSEDNDNNALIANLLGLGTNGDNFIGTYAWIAEKGYGVRAVKVTEGDEPQPLIGSKLDELLHPDEFKKFEQRGRVLDTAYGHRASRVVNVAARGEYLYVAEGKDGMVVYDISAIDNKSVAQRIREADNSGLGEKTEVRTKNATWVYLPSTLPMNLDRVALPMNHEQRPHPLYRYALITDSEEGLILVDVNTLTDGNPRNNFLERAVTFNPDGKLKGAVMVKTAGTYAYVLSSETGLHVVDLNDPLHPKLVWSSRKAHLLSPRALTIQFRYLFVLDRPGMKVFDITKMDEPQLVPEAFTHLDDPRQIIIWRTWALIAGGSQGLVILDVTNPEKPGEPIVFNAGGAINDATGITVGTTYTSTYAYVADGRNGLRLVRLVEPPFTPGHFGFSPVPTPALLATYPTSGEAVAVSDGQMRDRSVDESGNQIMVANRMGSRPFNREEMNKFLYENGQLLKVKDTKE